MTSHESVETFYNLFATGRIEEALVNHVATDAILDNPLPESIPFGGRFEGRAGFGAYLADIAKHITIEAFEVDEILVANEGERERVTVIGRETSLVPATGKRYAMEWVHILTLDDGRIVSMREYNDTDAMAEAFR